jgi:hypothetical protein
MTQTLFLGVATVFVAVGSFLASIQHRYTAYGFFVAAVIMVGFAVWAAYIEGVPKPHLVPVQYGKTDDADCEGLVFLNDGEPAYATEPPNPVSLGGSATIEFGSPADPVLTRLSKNGGLQTFPIVIREGHRQIRNDLRTQMLLWNVDEVMASFSYADARRPKTRRYTTVCKIFPTTKGVAIELVKVKFAWWRLRD